MKTSNECYNLILLYGYGEIDKGTPPFDIIKWVSIGKCPPAVANAYYVITHDEQYHLMSAWVRRESDRVVRALNHSHKKHGL
ncbi:MAG: hypothetical protein RR643_04950 [Anaerorhabdus sp.]|uniref:hypothetical protein n=1 Tax=Anaerorhabdus sp. TaxID=1872524 RepID=UPI002FCBDA49